MFFSSSGEWCLPDIQSEVFTNYIFLNLINILKMIIDVDTRDYTDSKTGQSEDTIKI